MFLETAARRLFLYLSLSFSLSIHHTFGHLQDTYTISSRKTILRTFVLSIFVYYLLLSLIAALGLLLGKSLECLGTLRRVTIGLDTL